MPNYILIVNGHRWPIEAHPSMPLLWAQDFEVLRFDEMPTLDTVILDSGAAPSGYGEHPVPLVAPAVANGLFAATGKRLRTLR